MDDEKAVVDVIENIDTTPELTDYEREVEKTYDPSCQMVGDAKYLTILCDRLVRKIDIRFIPVTIVIYLLCYLDRSNIGL